MNDNLIAWANIVDMFLYNNATLFLPFSVALIGGYMVDREYVQDTLKNMLVIPVYWKDMIKAKVAVLFILVIQLGFFEIALCLMAGVLGKRNGVTGLIFVQNAVHILLSNVCVTIGILPIILWSGRRQ